MWASALRYGHRRTEYSVLHDTITGDIDAHLKLAA